MQAESNTEIEKPKSKYGSKNIPIETLIDLRKKNLSYPEIASILKIHPKSVQVRLTPLMKDLELTDTFHKHRADILRYKQRLLLNGITAAKIEKANIQQLTWAFGVLFDKERLEMGQLTQIVGYVDLIKSKQRLSSEMDSIEAELVEAGIDPKKLSEGEKKGDEMPQQSSVLLQVFDKIKEKS